MLVFPKVLQRQRVPFVCKVFNDKTVVAFETVTNILEYRPGTVKFVTLIISWFQMINVKNSLYSYIKLRDVSCESWKFDCDSFIKLLSMCDAVSTFWWEGTRKQCHKLTMFTADTFVVTAIFNIAIATELLSNCLFGYILPVIFSQDPLENFWQTRQRFGGNFYLGVNMLFLLTKFSFINY